MSRHFFPPIAVILAFGLLQPMSRAAESGLVPTHLRCEYHIDPLGVDIPQPRLSWILTASDPQQRGQRQTAYQVLVASSSEKLSADQGDLWDSGKLQSGVPIHVRYAGKPLVSRTSCHWKVRVWDKDGRPSAWSKPACWSMGLMNREDWQARWIAESRLVARLAEANAYRAPPGGYHSLLERKATVEKWVVVDLGENRTIDEVRLHPARPGNSYPDMPGYLFPVRFSIDIAAKEDFSDVQTVVDRTETDVPNPLKKPMACGFPPRAARYVRLRATRLGQQPGGVQYGLAMVEMEVFSGGKNIAVGKKVSARDSLERAGYGTKYLCDGRLAMPDNIPRKRSSRIAPPLPGTMLRRDFEVAKPVRRATLYVTAGGAYEMRINGRRVGDHLFSPGWTHYARRIQYETFDVTSLVREGPNAIAAMIGEGWFAAVLRGAPCGPYPKLLAQLEIELADGSRQVIASDDAWQGASDGPIRESGIYRGEVYDARREMPGWDRPGFRGNAAVWSAVHSEPKLGDAQLVWFREPPMRVTEYVKPVKISEPQPGVYVFDLGQNIAGWCRLNVAGPAGTTVTLRHAERLQEDGTIYTRHLRTAKQTDVYTLRGGGPESFEPHFTYHGFRYVEVTGLPSTPTLDTLLGCVWHSDAPPAGKFACSDELVNRIMRNILWTQRGNLRSVLSDNPQRDERMGWSGDAQVFSQTSMFNMDMAAFFSKWVVDFRNGQTHNGMFPVVVPPHSAQPTPLPPKQTASSSAASGAIAPKDDPGVVTAAWMDAGMVLPWRMYVNYGDRRMLEEHYEAAKRWIAFVERKSPGLIGVARGYGDWVGGAVPLDMFQTAFFAYSTEIMAKMAEALGHEEDAKKYHGLHQRIKDAFNKAFVDANGRLKSDSQGAYALALHFDLLPERLRSDAAKHLVAAIHRNNGHLSTGMQLSHRVLLELSRHGHHDVACRLIQLRTLPSWGYMVEMGATTIWERWNSYVGGRGFASPGMNSFNQPAIGSVGEWVWRSLAGINPDEAKPGYEHVVIRPRPCKSIQWVKSEYDSIRGKIVSNWTLDAGKLTLSATIPPGASATVYMPAADANSVQESGQPAAQSSGVRFSKYEDGAAVFEVQSGSYRFESKSAIPASVR